MKKSTPPSTGWAAAAQEAFEQGAAEAISAVVARNAKDSEVLALALAALQAMAAIGLGGALLTNGAARALTAAFAEYSAAADLPCVRLRPLPARTRLF